MDCFALLAETAREQTISASGGGVAQPMNYGIAVSY
jgi:hypothetical protein